MAPITIAQLQRHIKTHTERSAEDRDAVSTLESFLRSGGRIHSQFAVNDTWPNVDGSFELVPDPAVSRQPKQNFVVQIKGVQHPRAAADGTVRYQLQSLAFPAYIAMEVSLDPGILFLVVSPGQRGQERVFWKYMSAQFLSAINFAHDSAVIDFTPEDEIQNTDESVLAFVRKLDAIADTHSYIKQLEKREYTREDVVKLVLARCGNISEAIGNGTLLNDTRDRLSRRILTELEDLCNGVLFLHGLRFYQTINQRVAWELALMNIETKFLATFLQGLRYIHLRVPEAGQYERLMLKYYGFLWRIRDYLRGCHMDVLGNLEDFPRNAADEDEQFNGLLAAAVETAAGSHNAIQQNRFYVKKKTPFYVGTQRYFEITLQLADKYATKYNRLTVYSKLDISSNYSIQVGYTEAALQLWNRPSSIRVVTDWRVSIEPASLNKLAQILGMSTRLSSQYGEYAALMDFLTRTGINLLDFIDMRSERFYSLLRQIYGKTNTSYFRDALVLLHTAFHEKSERLGHNTIRYALIRLQEDLLEALLPDSPDDALKDPVVSLCKGCYPFENNPIIYNLPRKRTNGPMISNDVLRSARLSSRYSYLPYLRMKYLIETTGELYHPREEIEFGQEGQTIGDYNRLLSDWDKSQGYMLKEEDGFVYIEKYRDDTVSILKNLLSYASKGNDGQRQLNRQYLSGLGGAPMDEAKLAALKTIFVDSRVLMIYGAAGTGKTTLLNYISSLMSGRSKLFLAKTHTALENLERRITSPGYASDFMSIDSFVKTRTPYEYDVVFVDECSTIDNSTMVSFLEKTGPDTLLVFAGDIYQIESIDFGNWFFYAKEILPAGAVAELTSTWRTRDDTLKALWEEVRFRRPLITEMLVMDGPFSENISEAIFQRADEDEVVLCLNYDGKFGLNSINSYFQDANPAPEVYRWSEWKYKPGDPILFNQSDRFPMLYNNLKGTIVSMESGDASISFTIDVPIVLTAIDVKGKDLEILSYGSASTRIRFTVYENDESKIGESYEEARMKSIVPFQLAYAVSIHKAQGLEYNSIKIVIPHSNSERISHGIFYTAITRAREKLKIFWSADTMAQVIAGFQEERSGQVSLSYIKSQVHQP